MFWIVPSMRSPRGHEKTSLPVWEETNSQTAPDSQLLVLAPEWEKATPDRQISSQTKCNHWIARVLAPCKQKWSKSFLNTSVFCNLFSTGLQLLTRTCSTPAGAFSDGGTVGRGNSCQDNPKKNIKAVCNWILAFKMYKWWRICSNLSLKFLENITWDQKSSAFRFNVPQWSPDPRGLVLFPLLEVKLEEAKWPAAQMRMNIPWSQKRRKSTLSHLYLHTCECSSSWIVVKFRFIQKLLFV